MMDERPLGAEACPADHGSEPSVVYEEVAVYWRPGCPFCGRLLRALEAAGVPMRRHDIWSDETAREFVRSHANGNETVPTVALGEVVLVNPDPAILLDALRTRALASQREPLGSSADPRSG